MAVDAKEFGIVLSERDIAIGAPDVVDVRFISDPGVKARLTQVMVGYLALLDTEDLGRAVHNLVDLYTRSSMGRDFTYQHVDVFGRSAAKVLKVSEHPDAPSMLLSLETTRRVVASQQGHANPLPLIPVD